MTNFKKLNLSEKILATLEKKGYKIPTPIQEQSIPHLLEKRDLLGIAQTGTGKTAAFSLPILDNLSKNKVRVDSRNARALILTPTRELASQIADNIKFYGRGFGFRSEVIFGGVSINNQIKALGRGTEIIVATPGRLLDLLNQGKVQLKQLEIFVLDEADRMLDMGFIHDVKKIISKLPRHRQTLFFSATMPKDIAKLASSILTDPVKVEVTPESTTVEKIDQRINLVEKSNKPLLLKSIIHQEDAKTILVFSKTKHGANRIVSNLEKESIRAVAIHGNKSQTAREKALESFRKGHVKILVATDIAARGIDIPTITHVINYDIPNDPENYVHRIGRTARAGREGVAISFCERAELDLLKAVEKTIKYKIPVDESHPFHGVKGKKVVETPRPPRNKRDAQSIRRGEKSREANRKRSENREDGEKSFKPKFEQKKRSDSSDDRNSKSRSQNSNKNLSKFQDTKGIEKST